MWFTVVELEQMDLPWTAEWIYSRGRGRTGEFVDLVFRRDWLLYHVLMFIAPDGTQSYPEAFPLDDQTLVVDCDEVELYATTRDEIMFRKVANDPAL